MIIFLNLFLFYSISKIPLVRFFYMIFYKTLWIILKKKHNKRLTYSSNEWRSHGESFKGKLREYILLVTLNSYRNLIIEKLNSIKICKLCHVTLVVLLKWNEMNTFKFFYYKWTHFLSVFYCFVFFKSFSLKD